MKGCGEGSGWVLRFEGWELRGERGAIIVFVVIPPATASAASAVSAASTASASSTASAAKAREGAVGVSSRVVWFGGWKDG